MYPCAKHGWCERRETSQPFRNVSLSYWLYDKETKLEQFLDLQIYIWNVHIQCMYSLKWLLLTIFLDSFCSQWNNSQEITHNTLSSCLNFLLWTVEMWPNFIIQRDNQLKLQDTFLYAESSERWIFPFFCFVCF